ncbi:carbon-nitrogen hydrolase family protein [Neptunicoccus cionae]|uniref:carbon-nitrogen hydrolase family protein n=1 Tax=Neptunicoccus cionae TaxID=2035344 RepID=UPI000C7867CD|nr:carbon-nitrogen hydrolase family protein [Amylibacter cionae]PLS21074.1 hypothetical protein C0U40_13050 [Amylibacter cionae]
MTRFTVACIQMTATPDVQADIETNLSLMQQAAEKGADVIALPEFCAGLDVKDGALAPVAFPETEHPAIRAFRNFARTRKVDVLVGSVAVINGDSLRNRSLLIGTDGEITARYDKIHMFDIDLGGGHRYCESDVMSPGDTVVTAGLCGQTVGLSICYDLRFPHLFRKQAKAGASLLFTPAAFTQPTGEAHWHVLQRARAIENGAFVIAPAQCGVIAGGSQLYGHSLIVDPWGKVLADAGDQPGFVLSEIDLTLVKATRQKIPSLANERQLN